MGKRLTPQEIESREVNKIMKKIEWNKFKDGATNPVTLSIARICFLSGIGAGSFIASFGFLKTSIGLFIMFLFIGLLQGVAIIQEVKQFKYLKQYSKMMDGEVYQLKKIMKEVL